MREVEIQGKFGIKSFYCELQSISEWDFDVL